MTEPYAYAYNWDNGALVLDIVEHATEAEHNVGHHYPHTQFAYNRQEMSEVVEEARQRGLNVKGWREAVPAR